MKISKITIKQLFGIKEWQGDGKNIELVGDNGTGKTSVIDAIRYALTNSSDREFIVKNGETEGEIYIETDNGLSIDRKARTAMTDYKSVKQNGNVIPSPESFLKTIFTPLQLSPMEFISMDKKTQNATILDMIQYDWNLDTIKEWFGEIPRDVNYEQNILAVLNDIQAENGYYFMHRQDVNRDIRAKKAVIADIGSSLPIDYDGERWEKENLSELYTEIEKIRKNKLNGRAYGDSFDDVKQEAKESGLVIVYGASDDLMEFDGAIYDEGGCFDGGRVYFDRDGVDQEGEERANWIDAVWCDGMNRDGLPATWTYKTDIPCEQFDIWEDGEIYCVGLVFSIEDLK